MENGIPSDGNDTYGFPFTYYTEYGGKMASIEGLNNQFQIEYLILDYFVAVIIVFIFVSTWSSLKRCRD